MKHEAWFFIGLFVFIFVVWIAVGGPTRGASISFPSLPETDASAGTTTTSGGFFSLPRAPFSIGETEIRLPGSSGGTAYESTGAGPASRYRGIVTLDYRVEGAGASDPRRETVGLSVTNGAPWPVDLTGWTLRSAASGRHGTIPRGTKVAKAGVVNEIADIELLPGERAIIASGPSPIGVSFEENECTGYLNQYQFFSPPLGQRCPDASADISNQITSHALDTACRNELADLTTCESPSLASGASHACERAMNTYLNYNGCVVLHQSDYSFGGSIWRLYLWSATPLFDPAHDTVELLDRQGAVVDAFTY